MLGSLSGLLLLSGWFSLCGALSWLLSLSVRRGDRLGGCLRGFWGVASAGGVGVGVCCGLWALSVPAVGAVCLWCCRGWKCARFGSACLLLGFVAAGFGISVAVALSALRGCCGLPLLGALVAGACGWVRCCAAAGGLCCGSVFASWVVRGFCCWCCGSGV